MSQHRVELHRRVESTNKKKNMPYLAILVTVEFINNTVNVELQYTVPARAVPHGKSF